MLGGRLAAPALVARALTSCIRGVCSGASGTVPAGATSFSDLAVPSACGTPGQPVALTLDGQPISRQTQAATACLAFAPGTSVSNLTIVLGVAPNPRC